MLRRDDQIDTMARQLNGTATAVLATCFGVNLFSRLGDIYILLLVPLQHEFGWPRAWLTGVYAVYLLTSGLVSPVAGLLFDRFGPRFVYVAGFALLAGAFLAIPRSDSLWHFYVTLGVTLGAGVALIGMVPAATLLTRWYGAKLTTAIGVASSASGLGALTIIPLAQYLIDEHGWRTMSGLMGGALGIVALMCGSLLPWRRFARGDPNEFRPNNAATDRGPRGGTMKGAFRSPVFWALAHVLFFTAAGMYAIVVQSVPYLVDMGFTRMLAAAAFGTMGALSVVSVGTSGALSDRFGYRRVAIASFLGTAVGIVLLGVLSVLRWNGVLIAYVVIYGLCQGSRGPIVAAMISKYFVGPRLATIQGMIYAMLAIGGALGAFVAGLLHDLTGNYFLGMAFALSAIALAMLPFFFVRRLRQAR
jgi:MFS family permease